MGRSAGPPAIEGPCLRLSHRVGKLSGGQQAQVALTLALAKRPELLLLDEPAASLDPLARRESLSALMEAVAEEGVTVVLSSHILADLERVCDHLVILSRARVVLAGSTDEITSSHRLLTGARREVDELARLHSVVHSNSTERQTTCRARRRESHPGACKSSVRTASGICLRLGWRCGASA